MSTPCTITPARLQWLQHLAKFGTTAWGRMPKRSNGLGAMTNQTWRPMVAAGLIEAKYHAPTWRDVVDHHFTITDAGRAALAKGES